MPSPLNTFFVRDPSSEVINPSSIISKRSHVVFFAAKVSAIYSASVDNNVTVVCLLKHQLIGPLFSMNT